MLFACLLGGGETAIDLAARAAPPQLAKWLFLSLGLFLSTVCILAYRCVVRAIEQRAPIELAWVGVANLSRGAAIGALLILAVGVALWFCGFVRIDGFTDLDHLPRELGIALTAAVTEEILFRGILCRYLITLFGLPAAVAMSAGLFGLAHLTNPYASVFSAITVGIEAGALLALAFAATNSLWYVIGLHFAWNFLEGAVFGANVSGGAAHGLLKITITGPAVLTGGDFGPEQSPFAVGASVIASLLFWRFATANSQSTPCDRARPAPVRRLAR